MALETTGRSRTNGTAPLRAFLWRLPGLRALLLLSPPLAWFVLVYLASLALLLVTAFWRIGSANMASTWP